MDTFDPGCTFDIPFSFPWSKSIEGIGCILNGLEFCVEFSGVCPPSNVLGSGAKNELFPEQSPRSLRLLMLTMAACDVP